jgi:hypothetical protein
MYDILDVISVLGPFGSGEIYVNPDPEPSFRPRMTMVPFSLTMYPDDILIYRSDPVTNDEGDAKRVFPNPGEPSMASVQPKAMQRTSADGRTQSVVVYQIATPTNIAVKTDDRIVWLDRKLTVEVATMPRGIGRVTFRTQCLEEK